MTQSEFDEMKQDFAASRGRFVTLCGLCGCERCDCQLKAEIAAVRAEHLTRGEELAAIHRELCGVRAERDKEKFDLAEAVVVMDAVRKSLTYKPVGPNCQCPVCRMARIIQKHAPANTENVDG